MGIISKIKSYFVKPKPQIGGSGTIYSGGTEIKYNERGTTDITNRTAVTQLQKSTPNPSGEVSLGKPSSSSGSSRSSSGNKTVGSSTSTLSYSNNQNQSTNPLLKNVPVKSNTLFSQVNKNKNSSLKTQEQGYSQNFEARKRAETKSQMDKIKKANAEKLKKESEGNEPATISAYDERSFYATPFVRRSNLESLKSFSSNLVKGNFENMWDEFDESGKPKAEKVAYIEPQFGTVTDAYPKGTKEVTFKDIEFRKLDQRDKEISRIDKPVQEELINKRNIAQGKIDAGGDYEKISTEYNKEVELIKSNRNTKVNEVIGNTNFDSSIFAPTNVVKKGAGYVETGAIIGAGVLLPEVTAAYTVGGYLGTKGLYKIAKPTNKQEIIGEGGLFAGINKNQDTGLYELEKTPLYEKALSQRKSGAVELGLSVVPFAGPYQQGISKSLMKSELEQLGKQKVVFEQYNKFNEKGGDVVLKGYRKFGNLKEEVSVLGKYSAKDDAYLLGGTGTSKVTGSFNWRYLNGINKEVKYGGGSAFSLASVGKSYPVEKGITFTISKTGVKSELSFGRAFGDTDLVTTDKLLQGSKTGGNKVYTITGNVAKSTGNTDKFGYDISKAIGGELKSDSPNAYGIIKSKSSADKLTNFDDFVGGTGRTTSVTRNKQTFNFGDLLGGNRQLSKLETNNIKAPSLKNNFFKDNGRNVMSTSTNTKNTFASPVLTGLDKGMNTKINTGSGRNIFFNFPMSVGKVSRKQDTGIFNVGKTDSLIGNIGKTKLTNKNINAKPVLPSNTFNPNFNFEPGFGFGGGIVGGFGFPRLFDYGRKRRVKSKKGLKGRYAPSVYAIGLNIKAPKVSDFYKKGAGAFAIRPLIESKTKSKRSKNGRKRKSFYW